jgi:hypothetical protein
MKTVYLLACLLLLSITTFGQSFTGPTSVASGTTVTLQASGESYNTTAGTAYYYFTAINSIPSAEITYPSSPANASQYITINLTQVTNKFTPLAQSPTTFKVTCYNDAPTGEPITITFKVSTQYAYKHTDGTQGTTGAEEIPYTITITPGNGPTGTFYSAAYSQPFTPACQVGYVAVPATVTYSVPAKFRNSLVSQAVANQLAVTYVQTNGQNVANISSQCFDGIYVKLVESNILTNQTVGTTTGVTEATFNINFYSNAACTIPLTLTQPLTVLVNDQNTDTFNGTTNNTTTYSVAAGTNTYLIGTLLLSGTFHHQFLSDPFTNTYTLLSNSTDYITE